MRKSILLVLASLAIAGCSGDAASETEDPLVDESTFDDVDVKATDTTGIIRGIVVDETITPLEGATLTLTGPNTSLKTTTTAAGAFGFDGLDGGSYFIRAEKAGYSDIQQSVDVVAGDKDPPIVKILMATIPGGQLSADVLTFEGFLECSVLTGPFFMPCEEPFVYGEIGNDDYYNGWNLTQNASFIHLSLVWEPTQPFGTELYYNLLDSYDAGYNVAAYGGGPSPQVGNADEDALAPLNSAGLFAVEVASNGESTVQGLAGVSLQQDFTVYVVVFRNWAPPEGYAFWSDGEPDIPQ